MSSPKTIRRTEDRKRPVPSTQVGSRISLETRTRTVPRIFIGRAEKIIQPLIFHYEDERIANLDVMYINHLHPCLLSGPNQYTSGRTAKVFRHEYTTISQSFSAIIRTLLILCGRGFGNSLNRCPHSEASAQSDSITNFEIQKAWFPRQDNPR